MSTVGYIVMFGSITTVLLLLACVMLAVLLEDSKDKALDHRAAGTKLDLVHTDVRDVVNRSLDTKREPTRTWRTPDWVRPFNLVDRSPNEPVFSD